MAPRAEKDHLGQAEKGPAPTSPNAPTARQSVPKPEQTPASACQGRAAGNRDPREPPESLRPN